MAMSFRKRFEEVHQKFCPQDTFSYLEWVCILWHKAKLLMALMTSIDNKLIICSIKIIKQEKCVRRDVNRVVWGDKTWHLKSARRNSSDSQNKPQWGKLHQIISKRKESISFVVNWNPKIALIAYWKLESCSRNFISTPTKSWSQSN